MLDILMHRYLRIPYALHIHTERKVKKARATVVLLHGIGGSGAGWDAVVAKLPKDLTILSVDLLGFGKSPSPKWAVYNTTTQAKSVIATLLRRRIGKQVILVGHSMGSLVAVEIAKRYPILVRSLVLCSPPLYTNTERRRLLPNRDKALRGLYRLIQKHPQRFIAIAPLATKYKLMEEGFNLTDENIDSYIAALEASIIHQTSLEDMQQLKKPIRILHGAFDPVVIKKNLKKVVRANTNATLTVIRTGHSMLGTYIPAVVQEVEQAVAVSSQKAKSKKLRTKSKTPAR